MQCADDPQTKTLIKTWQYDAVCCWSRLVSDDLMAGLERRHWRQHKLFVLSCSLAWQLLHSLKQHLGTPAPRPRRQQWELQRFLRLFLHVRITTVGRCGHSNALNVDIMLKYVEVLQPMRKPAIFGPFKALLNGFFLIRLRWRSWTYWLPLNWTLLSLTFTICQESKHD